MKINKKCIITLLGIVIASPIAINSSISSASVFTRILQRIRSSFRPLTSRNNSMIAYYYYSLKKILNQEKL